MATSEQFDSLRYFSAREFQRPESMSYELLWLLDQARELACVPFVITSDVRPGSPEHVLGCAVDIRCHDSSTRFRILKAVMRVGFRRVGVYDRHIHVGVASDLVQDVVWMGVSK